MDINKLRLRDKNLYYEIPDWVDSAEALNKAAYAIKQGLEVILLPVNAQEVRKTIDLGRKLRELCSIFNLLFFVKSRIDIAQIVHSDGIVLSSNEINIKEARLLTENQMIIGFEVFSLEDVAYAIGKEADFIVPAVNSLCTQNLYKGIKILTRADI